ncbi:uncharacterized protein EI90DRAFT_3296679 [Cantharellus anzutake]|uniref:uncharacterized protein n=1 Tax=Cantharellus anzutake TaxID=1750568 RepID=UPI00190370DB|nr:uncharacterized protein EI90DRAFT_3296679 [Cantharellus anzutake]KAF8309450.1 hypothetical protein EI90DRAFT_3296679 [Cantharellus anzutake]
MTVATQDSANSPGRLHDGAHTGWLRHLKFHHISQSFSQVGRVVTTIHKPLPEPDDRLNHIPLTFISISPDAEHDAATAPGPTALDCTELKPKRLRPGGLSIELPSDIDPEPLGVPAFDDDPEPVHSHDAPETSPVHDSAEHKLEELRPGDLSDENPFMFEREADRGSAKSVTVDVVPSCAHGKSLGIEPVDDGWGEVGVDGWMVGWLVSSGNNLLVFDSGTPDAWIRLLLVFSDVNRRYAQ